MNLISEIQKEVIALNELPSFKSGDTVSVSYKIKEGNKERTQQSNQHHQTRRCSKSSNFLLP